MQKLIFGLSIAATLALTVASGQAGSVNAVATLDLANKSDQCVWWDIPGERNGELKPGHSTVISVMSASYSSSRKVIAKIVNCSNNQLIPPERYDYIPISGRSQLTIHKVSNNSYIMRHGP